MSAPRRPTVDTAVEQYFGMQPGMDRLNLLPRHDRKQGWIAPNMVYQLARAMVSPGVAAHGGDVSPEDAVNFAGNVSLGSFGASAAMKNPTPGPGKTLPMTVYHGSPHDFDKFDMSKIGTGEGAQAYGHGLYVAESKDVAKSYQTTLTQTAPKGDNVGAAHNFVNKFGGDEEYAREILQQQIEAMGNYSPNAETARGMLAAINDGSYKGYKPPKGATYTVDLPDSAIANMLDWDAPLSQQPESVRAAFKRRITEPKAIDGMDMGGNARLRDNRQRQADPTQVQPWVLETQSGNGTSRFGLSQKDVDRLIGGQDINALTGAQIYQRMAAEHGGFPQASEMMKNLGIPGIRYFDGASRTAGNGTRNFVVFDDKLLKILRKE